MQDVLRYLRSEADLNLAKSPPLLNAHINVRLIQARTQSMGFGLKSQYLYCEVTHNHGHMC